METTSLRREAIAETYNDTQNLINATVGYFHRRYGGDFEELRAEANLIFILAYETYNRKKGPFPTWIRWCLWKDLLTYTKTLYNQCHNTITNGEDFIKIFVSRTKDSFSPLELLDGTRADTKVIIHLIWNPPKEIRNIKVKNGNHPCHMKTALKNYLFKLGWTGRRIKESFEEITRLINE